MTTLQLTKHAMNQPSKMNYAQTAKIWREIAQKAQEEGDFDAMRMSHMRALQNEILAKEADKKAEVVK